MHRTASQSRGQAAHSSSAQQHPARDSEPFVSLAAASTGLEGGLRGGLPTN